MRSLALKYGRTLSAAFHRTGGVHAQMSNIQTTFAYCSHSNVEKTEMGTVKSDPNVGEKRKVLSFRIAKLPKGQSVEIVFQKWMGEGLPVQKRDIYRAVERLRELKFFRRALEVMVWVIREKPYKPKELDYSYLLEFAIKIHGISEGEKVFVNVPAEFQNDLLYNNLVLACLDKGAIIPSLEYMKKMRELGHPISYLVFNRLIILNSSPMRRRNMIPKILAQMKADEVTIHVSTFNILLEIEAKDHDIEGLMRVFGDMNKANIEPNEITYCILANAHAVARLLTVCESYVKSIEDSKTGTNWSTYDVLMILYGYLGKLKDLQRIWGIIHEQPHASTKCFLIAIEAFGRIGRLDIAEELWEELKSKKGVNSTEQYNSIISVYCQKGIVDKVSGIFKEMKAKRCKPNSITFRHLALGCLKAGLTKEAMKTLDMGSKRIPSRTLMKSTPWLETTLSIIDMLAEKGDVEYAEKLFDELGAAKYTRYTFVWNSLFKAYVHAKANTPDLLRRMILAGARPDAETYSLVKLIEQFRK